MIAAVSRKEKSRENTRIMKRKVCRGLTADHCAARDEP
jgi:hypothetical protein